jgi:hypothetical protein
MPKTHVLRSQLLHVIGSAGGLLQLLWRSALLCARAQMGM